MRDGEWLLEIAHLNIFMNARKNVDEPATSVQLGHFCRNYNIARNSCGGFLAVVKGRPCFMHKHK
jgi:hypothetical protein